MCIYSPMPHTLSYCALIGKCALIRSNTVVKLKHFAIATTPKANSDTRDSAVALPVHSYRGANPKIRHIDSQLKGQHHIR